jgi:hypothetical protein
VSVVSVVYCQEEVSATGCSLVQREPTERERERERDREASPMMRSGPLAVVVPLKTVRLQESYDTRYIYLSESYRRLK